MKQVLDIKQMQHLQELGLDTSNANMAWCKYDGEKENSHLLPKEECVFERCLVVKYIPAYTLQDVLELLPSSVNWNRLLITFNGCECTFQYSLYESDPIVAFHNEEMIDAAYAMLCWCIENGHIKTNKENMQ